MFKHCFQACITMSKKFKYYNRMKPRVAHCAVCTEKRAGYRLSSIPERIKGGGGGTARDIKPDYEQAGFPNYGKKETHFFSLFLRLSTDILSK